MSINATVLDVVFVVVSGLFLTFMVKQKEFVYEFSVTAVLITMAPLTSSVLAFIGAAGTCRYISGSFMFLAFVMMVRKVVVRPPARE